MATVSGEDVKHLEKATLKRKLTGPPRLLLGKARTRSVEDRHEAQTHKDKLASGNESSLKHSDSTKWTEPTNVVLSDMSCRGRCEAAGKDDITDRKVNRHGWWRRLSPAVVCKRRQQSNVKDVSEKNQKNTDCVSPEGALQETDSTEENGKETKGKMRFKARKFKMFPSLSNSRLTHEQKRGLVDQDGAEPSLTFGKKMQRFFSRGVSRRRGVPQNMEAPSSSAAQPDEPSELHGRESVRSVEVVTVLTEKRVAERTPTEDQPVCHISVNEEDLMATTDLQITNRSEMIQADNKVPINDLKEVTSPETDEDFCASTKVILDADNRVVTSSTSPHEACEGHRKTTDETTSCRFPPSTNGPSIRIDLVPPDEVVQDEEGDEEEARWGDTSSENHNHLLLLLGFESSERQLVQVARSLVRAAVNAAVDQLSGEQQSDSDCVHRDLLSCRDHA